jgi:hypothetical protein
VRLVGRLDATTSIQLHPFHDFPHIPLFSYPSIFSQTALKKFPKRILVPGTSTISPRTPLLAHATVSHPQYGAQAFLLSSSSVVVLTLPSPLSTSSQSSRVFSTDSHRLLRCSLLRSPPSQSDDWDKPTIIGHGARRPAVAKGTALNGESWRLSMLMLEFTSVQDAERP